MEFPTRLPVVPTPHSGELLSCWLQRLSDTYRVSVPDLVAALRPASELSKEQLKHLDQIAPDDLLQALNAVTGITRPQLRQMTFGDWAVSLRGLQCSEPQPTFAQYIRDFRVFDWPLDLTSDEAVPRIAWQTDRDVTLVCPHCYMQNGECVQQLIWACGLLSSCPIHGCETTSPGMPPSTLMGPRPIDSITLTIMTVGHATLPNGVLVHGRQWFRFLRSLLCELEQHPGFHQPFSPTEQPRLQIWERCGLTPPRVYHPYDYFEVAGLIRRRDLLTLANIAGTMLLSGQIIPPTKSRAWRMFAQPSGKSTDSH